MRLIALLLLALAVVVLPLACSSEKTEPPKVEASKPLGEPDSLGFRAPDFVWGVEKHRMMSLYFEPTDTLRMYAPDILKKGLEIYQIACEILVWNNPEPIALFCFKDMPTLAAHTSRNQPFFMDNRIFYGYGPPYGRVITELVMSKLPEGPTQFEFMKEGIPALLDFSGRNYHHTVNDFIKEGTILPVAEITDNKKYLELRPVFREIHAASLIGYMNWEWGSEKLMQIYHSDKDFETALKEVTGASLDQLEKQWQAFAPEHTDEKDAERAAQMMQEGSK